MLPQQIVTGEEVPSPLSTPRELYVRSAMQRMSMIRAALNSLLGFWPKKYVEVFNGKG